MEVDVFVLSVFMYNFGILFILKVWIDNVVCVGIMFKYIVIGLVGLVKNIKVVVLIVWGGVYVGILNDM